MNNSLPDTVPGLRANRLYGRSRGRPLSPHQASLMDALYPKIKIDPQAPLEGASDYAQTAFEIGFGASEHLIWQAEHNPDCLFLGAEPYLNGVAKALAAINKKSLSNVRLLNGDAREILAHLPPESLDHLFVLFPDPWPKARHNKRRIINEAFLSEAHRVLKPGARFRFASDIIHYVDWTLTRLHAHGGFDWNPETNQDWRERPDDWPATRYEAKAIREGRPCHYFTFIRA